MYEVILGRSSSDTRKYGKKGSVFIGKQYVQMGQSFSLGNQIFMDVSRSHAMLMCGKRGSGKSYTLGSICEGLFDIEPSTAKNLCFILMDTMGVYWSMKYSNEKQKELCKSWGLETKGLDVVVYVPGGFYEKYLDDKIPVDFPFYIKPKDLTIEDWVNSFGLKSTDILSVLISKAINSLLNKKFDFDLDDIILEIEKDTKSESKDKVLAQNFFDGAKSWGVFSKTGTDIKTMLQGGKTIVMDLSPYVSMSGGQMVKSLVLGLLSKKIFVLRMLIRKAEEKRDIEKLTKAYSDNFVEGDIPMPWIIVDEAHEFLPRDEMVPSSIPLITILREGRQPGVSLILATQQPGKIHTDAITQSDIVLSHRITAALDLEALDRIFLSYDSKGSKALFNSMPKTKGCAIIMDDKNERLHTMQIKPRISWHGGEDPNAIEEVEEEFNFD